MKIYAHIFQLKDYHVYNILSDKDKKRCYEYIFTTNSAEFSFSCSTAHDYYSIPCTLYI